MPIHSNVLANIEVHVILPLQMLHLEFAGKSLEQFRESLNDFHNKGYTFNKSIAGPTIPHNWTSVKVRNPYGDFFSVVALPESIVLYDHNGSTVLEEVKISSNLEKKHFDTLCEISIIYSKGQIKCSDCKKIIRRENIAGRFYAGIFCHDCWERTWKEREARENYD